ncbi:TPA: hypothetical protein H2R31_005048 [Salmonella enterica]|nr:hypothetical protein [Salmonella enterica]
MAFSWTEERIAYLRENAGKVKTRELAEALGTNITAVRNMAVRLRLSLRVKGYSDEQAGKVRELYYSEPGMTARTISSLTGLPYSVVCYILYASSARKNILPFTRTTFIEFESGDNVRRCVQAELVNTFRTCTDKLTDGGPHDIWLLDGTHFTARKVSFVEQITSARYRKRG